MPGRLPNRLARKVNATKLCKLLCREGRAEVRVTLPDDADGCSSQSRRVAAVARPAAAEGYQGLRALQVVGLGQPEHLTPTIRLAARSCNTLIRSISVRLIAITVIGPKLLCVPKTLSELMT